MTKELGEYQSFALRLRDEARAVIRSELSSGLEVSQKSDKSFVTSLDTAIEKKLSALIKEQYPDHGIIGEEFGETNSDARYVWTLDPIDGTEELVHGTVTYGTIIGLLRDGVPVFGLIDHEKLDLCVHGGEGLGVCCNGNEVGQLSSMSESRRLYIGSRSQFIGEEDESAIFDKAVQLFPNVRVFCSCYGFTSLVLDQADVCVEFNLKIWDLAAVEALTRAVGGEFVRFGERKRSDGLELYGAVFGKADSVQEMLAALQI